MVFEQVVVFCCATAASLGVDKDGAAAAVTSCDGGAVGLDLDFQVTDVGGSGGLAIHGLGLLVTASIGSVSEG